MDLSTTMGLLWKPLPSRGAEDNPRDEKKVLAKGKLLATIGAKRAAAKELYDRGYS
jgi:hypothetical protein